MTARTFGQTRISATAPAPIPGDPPLFDQEVSAHLVVETRALRRAEPQAFADLQTLLRASIIRKGGDPERITWTAEPVGPQIELAAVNGRTL